MWLFVGACKKNSFRSQSMGRQHLKCNGNNNAATAWRPLPTQFALHLVIAWPCARLMRIVAIRWQDFRHACALYAFCVSVSQSPVIFVAVNAWLLTYMQTHASSFGCRSCWCCRWWSVTLWRRRRDRQCRKQPSKRSRVSRIRAQ